MFEITKDKVDSNLQAFNANSGHDKRRSSAYFADG
jgi:hypothetical protein